MAQTFVLVLIFSYYAGSWGQFVLTQPPSLSVAPGGRAVISCTRNTASINKYHVSWYQQKPNGLPKLLIYQHNKRPPGIPERFSGFTGGSSATLTISNVQADDLANYYCSSYDSNWLFIFGGGTQLTVTGQPTVAPTLNAYASSEEEIKTQNKATLVCLVNGFYPPAFNLKWKGDNKEITSGVETTKATKQGDKYLASSYLTLSASDYQNHDEYTCEVTHGGKNFEKTVRKSGSC